MSGFAERRPPVSRLVKWLDEKPAKLERYLADHPEAEAELSDELDRLTALTDSARSALASALVAPVDLSERLRSRIGPPPTGTETSAVLMDLLGLGLRTAQVLFGEDPPARS